MNNQTSTKIDEGSINFWIKPNQLNFKDNNATPLIQVGPTGGSIFIVKDSDNFIKFFHVFIGKGRTDAIHDVSQLDPSQPHMVTATWSVSKGVINLYIDGELATTAKIQYSKNT